MHVVANFDLTSTIAFKVNAQAIHSFPGSLRPEYVFVARDTLDAWYCILQILVYDLAELGRDSLQDVHGLILDPKA